MADSNASTEPTNPAAELRRRYVFSLALIAGVLLVTSVGVDRLLSAHEADGPAIDAAGHQRMLSQRLVKELLQLRVSTSQDAIAGHLAEVHTTLAELSRGQARLQREIQAPSALFATDALRAGFAEVAAAYAVIERSRHELAAAGEPVGRQAQRVIEGASDAILASDEVFLRAMDRMVGLYAAEVSERAAWLRRAHGLVTALALLVLIATGLLVMEPAARLVGRQFGELRRFNAFLTRIFGRYVSDEVVHRLLDTPDGLEFGGEERKVTLLMSDLRGFSALSSGLSPRTTIRLLNEYLDRMAKVIAEHGGTIQDFMGDCIFALFGAPLEAEDDARRAVECALSMQLELNHINRTFRDQGLPPLGFGIGIHTGTVIAGNVGSKRRAKYGVVGPSVNLAGRLEDCALAGQILVSRETLAELGPDAELADELAVQVKGFEEPLRAFELVGLEGGLQLPRREASAAALLTLGEDLPVCFRRVIGDEVEECLWRGSILRLAQQEAEIRARADLASPGPPLASERPDSTRRPVVLHDEIELSLNPTADRILATTVYAKVTKLLPSESAFRVRFTSVSPAARAIIEGVVRAAERRAAPRTLPVRRGPRAEPREPSPRAAR